MYLSVLSVFLLSCHDLVSNVRSNMFGTNESASCVKHDGLSMDHFVLHICNNLVRLKLKQNNKLKDKTLLKTKIKFQDPYFLTCIFFLCIQ